MSLRKRLRVLIPAFVILALLGVIPAEAGAGEGIPSSPSCLVTLISGDEAVALPPTCFDPAGSDQDELVIPSILDPSGWGGEISYFINGEVVFDSEVPLSTNGLASLSITTQFWSPTSGLSDGPSWRLDFNVEPVGVVPPDTYWVEVGGCFDRGWLRHVTAYTRNEASADERLIHEVWPHTISVDGGTGTVGIKPMSRIFDGETASTALYTFEDTEPGLAPGVTYVVTFWQATKGSAVNSGNSTRFIAHRETVKIPSCSSDGGGTQVSPKATIKVGKCRPRFCRVIVTLGSHKATKVTKYTVVKPGKNPVYRVRHKTVRYHKIKKGALIKVRAGGHVLAKKRVRR